MNNKHLQNTILVTGFIFIMLLIIILMLRHSTDTFSGSPSPSQFMSVEDYTGLTESELASDSSWIENTESSLPDILCVNSRSFSCELFSGGILTVGYDNTDENGCILLYPLYSPSSAEPDSPYGIYINAYSGRISLLLEERQDTSPPSTSVFTGMTYDTAVPVYPDTVRYYPGAGIPDGNIYVSLRVVRLADYTVCGTAKCMLSVSEATCRIVSVFSTDVSHTGEVDADYRTDIISKALDYVLDTSKGPVFSSSDSFPVDYIRSCATVERCAATYFPGLLDSSGDYIRSGTLSRMELTAVNLPLPGAGNVTIYLAPELQLEGFSISSAFFIEDTGPVPFAYDFLYPFSEETLLVPDNARIAYDSCSSSYFHEVSYGGE